MKLFPRFLLEGEGGGGGGGGFTPSFDGALKPDGSFSEGWHQKAFGADYNGPLSTAKTFGDVDKMLKDSMAAARAKTEGMIKVPGADAKAEEIAAYRKAIGVPEKPDEYGHKLPDGVDEKALNKEQLSAWKSRLHAQGLSKSQAETIINEYLNEQFTTQKAMSEQFAKGIEAEKIELAKRFPEIDKTVAAVKSLANKPGVPESLKAAIAKGAFDPQNTGAFWGADAMEFAAWAAKMAGEDGTKGGGGGNGGMTIAEAKNIMNDASHPLHAKYKAGDKEITGKISAAYEAGI